MTHLADVAATSDAVAAAAGRSAKTHLLAACLAAVDDADLPVVVLWLGGATRQRRTGLGWASLRDRPPPAEVATLTVAAVDAALDRAAAATGPGSQGYRRDTLGALLGAATEPEQRLLAGLVTGELRHGAAAGLVLDAVAAASGVPGGDVRRAVTLSGSLADVAAALRAGGPGALATFRLTVGRPLAPMLAGTAPDLPAALGRTGPAAVEWKLDGVRVQVHRDGEDVAVFTRTLDDVTTRLPDVVAAARALPVRSAVLDGEVIALRPDGRPEPFQVTSSRVARHDRDVATTPLTTLVFDALHFDGVDLLDEPGTARRGALDGAVGAPAAPSAVAEAAAAAGATAGAAGQMLVVPRTVVQPDDPDSVTMGTRFAEDALARGHEGVVVKSLAAPYAMGRRGVGWIKVKPRLTLDLVVLAAEWGHGRRTGLLSNLHLGARDPDGAYGPPGGWVMLGKTFKGLTDAMLAWQTEELQRIAVRGRRGLVEVRPDLVVEIAFDGVQSSPRYPAGVALRFARVVAHRPDKPAAQADTVATVLGLALEHSRATPGR